VGNDANLVADIEIAVTIIAQLSANGIPGGTIADCGLQNADLRLHKTEQDKVDGGS